MKKILSLFLVLALIFSLCACNENKAEKYCSECGKGIEKNVAFCEHCGASLKSNNESSSTSSTQSQKQETSETTTVVSSKPTTAQTQSSKPTTTQTTSSKPTPVHTHSYSKKVTAATCTQKGYTTYTCSCGHSYKDDYTNPTHKFEKYKCINCSEIDKNNLFGFLREVALSKGIISSGYAKYTYMQENNGDSSSTSALLYDIINEEVIFCRELISGDAQSLTIIVIPNYSTTSYTYEAAVSIISADLELGSCHGTINAPSHTKNSNIECSFYNVIIGYEDQIKELTKLEVNNLITAISIFFGKERVNYGIANMGFTNFQ